jgi:hypothetical protein
MVNKLEKMLKMVSVNMEQVMRSQKMVSVSHA